MSSLGPAQLILSTGPGLVLGGGGQLGQEHLASPVVRTLLHHSGHGVAPARFTGETHLTHLTHLTHSLPAAGGRLGNLQSERRDGRVAEAGPLQQEGVLGVSVSRRLELDGSCQP